MAFFVYFDVSAVSYKATGEGQWNQNPARPWVSVPANNCTALPKERFFIRKPPLHSECRCSEESRLQKALHWKQITCNFLNKFCSFHCPPKQPLSSKAELGRVGNTFLASKIPALSQTGRKIKQQRVQSLHFRALDPTLCKYFNISISELFAVKNACLAYTMHFIQHSLLNKGNSCTV